MMDNFYNGNKLVEEYSSVGVVELNQMAGVARIQPFVEERVEIIIDDSIGPEVDLEDIPPHLKHTLELFFINTKAIYPTKHMIQCLSPGKLQTFTGKVWEDIPYRDEWSSWEDYIKEMDKIDYPFVVLPNQNIYPRTFRLIEANKMELFKTLLQNNNRQVTLKEFEDKWVHLFNPANENNPDYPLAAWMHVCISPNAYVDVIEVNSDRSANIVFTVPPLMSLNQGSSSVMADKKTVHIENMIMRCRSESAVIPKSGDGRLLNTFTTNQAEPQELSKHAQMWKTIYDRYGWSFITDSNNSVISNKNTVTANAGQHYEDQMDDIIF